jgi:hypothetical protein
MDIVLLGDGLNTEIVLRVKVFKMLIMLHDDGLKKISIECFQMDIVVVVERFQIYIVLCVKRLKVFIMLRLDGLKSVIVDGLNKGIALIYVGTLSSQMS